MECASKGEAIRRAHGKDGYVVVVREVRRTPWKEW